MSHKYKTNAELEQMSALELDQYTNELSALGLDTGPEWDRIYTYWENTMSHKDGAEVANELKRIELLVRIVNSESISEAARVQAADALTNIKEPYSLRPHIAAALGIGDAE